jgi:hypothetical protein
MSPNLTTKRPAAARSRWVVVRPPLFILLAAALIAFAVGSALAPTLTGEMDFSGLAWFAAACGFSLYSSIFLWLDVAAVTSLPDRTWPTESALWTRVVVSAGKALLVSIVLGPVAALAGVALTMHGRGRTAFFGLPVLAGLSAILGAVQSVRARLRTSVAARP